MGGEKINQRIDNPRPSSSNMPSPPAYQEKSQDTKLWGVVIFGLIGATATTYAVRQLRRTADELYAQLTRSQSTWKGGSGTSKSFRTYFQEEAWINYNRRMQEAYEEEMERVERIRRMQSVFNRGRNKFKRDYERWRENGPGAYHQHFQRDDLYWKTDSSFRDQRGLTSGELQETVEAIHYHIITQFWDLTGLEQNHILKLRLRHHSEPRQRSFTRIRTKIIKRLPRQSSKR